MALKIGRTGAGARAVMYHTGSLAGDDAVVDAGFRQAGIYGTSPAGGGYQGISPTILFAHKNCNIAVGGGGILSGMSPKGCFDEEGAEALISAAKQYKAKPPGSVDIHYDETGFFRYAYEKETEVLDGLKDYMGSIPAYAPKFFRVADPHFPKFSCDDLYRIMPFDQKRSYVFKEVLARLVDGSQHMEYKPEYGPEVYTGLVKPQHQMLLPRSIRG